MFITSGNKSRWNWSLAKVAAVGAGFGLSVFLTTASFAQAQQQPANAPMNNGAAPAGQSDQADSQNQSEFPAIEVRGAVEANARCAFARANFHRLQYSLDQMIRHMQYDFEHSKDLVDASKAEQQAWENYLAARHEALKPVVSDPNYIATVELKEAMGRQIAETREAYAQVEGPKHHARLFVDTALMKQLVNMATVKLDYAQVATDMEIAALRNNSSVADARTKLMDAGKHVADLRDGFDKQVRDSKELAALREQIEDARVQFVTAEAFRSGAIDAANVALGYAFYKYRYPNSYAGYGYPMDFSYVGYGYGRPIYRY